MDPTIIRPGDDPMAEEPTFTLTLSLEQAFGVCSAVSCIYMASTGEDANSAYREFGEYGEMEAAHEVADRLHELMEPHIRRVGAVIRAHVDALKRQN